MKNFFIWILKLVKTIFNGINKVLRWVFDDPVADARRNTQASLNATGRYVMNSKAEGELPTAMKSGNMGSRLSNTDNSGSNYKNI